MPGVAGGILSPYDMGGTLPQEGTIGQPMPTTTLVAGLTIVFAICFNSYGLIALFPSILKVTFFLIVLSFLPLSSGLEIEISATAPPENVQLAMAIDAFLQSAMHPHLGPHLVSGADVSTSRTNSECIMANCRSFISGTAPLQKEEKLGHKHQETSANGVNSVPASIPSAPPVADSAVDDGPIHYPSIDTSPLDFSSPPVERVDAKLEERTDIGASSSCVICLDAPIEGACIPCGHMTGCMSCLSEIKAKKWGCPVCRAKIDQVVRLYAV
ncbi:putative E3 ubiquitin-protein ligase XBAT35 [Coffea eugenioides]|uniref:putative E3 ubiquitin-protein ligase XBAT35 n=1 Tax=Coffea eugenioides TaxID=49369 RepID=UPI000F5D4DCE|nr:putative E3 ubiquitin-protein ligase XBAT35 [Coffea arabica]XP_027169925.1 putative E3 ubiquitin-protein ligase XBAT35 [Coffea eugenioides]